MLNIQSFLQSEEDLRRLYLTYAKQPDNYQRIKEKVAGQDSQTFWKKAQKRRFMFIGGVAVVAATSSVFFLFSDSWSSIAAIWVIWLLTSLLFLAISAVSYQTSYKILLGNMAFFDKFELIADAAQSVEDFGQLWSQSKQG